LLKYILIWCRCKFLIRSFLGTREFVKGIFGIRDFRPRPYRRKLRSSPDVSFRMFSRRMFCCWMFRCRMFCRRMFRCRMFCSPDVSLPDVVAGCFVAKFFPRLKLSSSGILFTLGHVRISSRLGTSWINIQTEFGFFVRIFSFFSFH